MLFVFLQRNSCPQFKVEQLEFDENNLSISSGKEEKYHYDVKFCAILRMYDTKQISKFSAPDWCQWNYHTIYIKSFINL